MDSVPGDPTAGLSDAEAQARLQRDGPNRLPPPEHHSLATLLLRATLQPMALLLLACTLLYALLGDALDAAVLGASIVGVVAISALQEMRAQRVIEALRDLASPRSTVWRSGRLLRIASQELVQGDRLVVQEGDRLACDARLLRAHGLRLDESLLTGESVPVDKQAAADAHADPDPAAQLHAGTLVVQGDGVALVTATGPRTTLGRIGGSLAALPPRPSRLHQDLQRLVRTIALLALAVCLLAATLFAWRSGSWTSGLLVGLTLAMSIVPEEFAVVWAVMLALGAWRLARAEQVLTRQPQAIEALGATTVLCVDKTGTLTRNRMAVVALHDGAQGLEGVVPDTPQAAPIPAALAPLLQAARLASVAEGLEPMDQALLRLRLAEDADADADAVPPAPALLRRDGVVPGRPFVRQCWRAADGGTQIVALKGAPEALLPRCSDSPERLQALQQRARDWAARGWRVLAVAQARCPLAMAAPDEGYQAVGLLAFEDPLREDVPAALQACHAAGLRVVMITGDAPATALAIATQAGLAVGGGVLAGNELEAMNEVALELAVRRVNVYARVTPAQKLRLVQALQRRGEVVAMTGDGVNDGPALRAADVGVAMGQRGTDVAREAAALVLLDDRFGALVEAVRAGRRIFANLQKSLGYLVAAHVPIVGLALMPLLPLLGGPVLLLPLHVVLFELIVDPACSLVFEAEPLSAKGMHVPPRPAAAPLFSAGAAGRALVVGMLALLGTAAVQALGHAQGWSDAGLRGAGLASLVIGNLLMLVWFRRGGAPAARNPVFVGLIGAIGALALPLMTVPALRGALGIAAAPAAWLLLPAAALLWAAWAGWRLRACTIAGLRAAYAGSDLAAPRKEVLR